MTIRFLTDYAPYKVGNSTTLDSATETALIAQKIATADLTGAVAYVPPAVRATGAWIPLTVNKTIEASDDGKCYAAINAITVTIPSGLSPRPSVCVMPAPSGNLSLTGTLNGSAQTLTRTRANNPSGVAINAYQDADGYGCSGS